MHDNMQLTIGVIQSIYSLHMHLIILVNDLN